jgi:hypothetical protein
MATEDFDSYVFEHGQFVAYKEPVRDALEWSVYLDEQGYADQEQVWGQYPDVYVKVYEARPDAVATFRFVAVLNVVCFPHHVFIRDLNGLVQLITLLQPLFKLHGRPDEASGEALFGSQGADEQADHVRR